MVEKSRKLPLLPLRDQSIIVFPGLPAVIDVGRAISLDAIAAAQASKSHIIVAVQRDPDIESPTASDLWNVCTEAEIKSVVPLDDEGLKKRVILVGISRAKLKTAGKILKADLTYLNGEFLPYEEVEVKMNANIDALTKTIVEVITRNMSQVILKNGKALPKNSKDLSMFIDNIVGQLDIDGKKKLSFLAEPDVLKRIENLAIVIGQESERLKNAPKGGSVEMDEEEENELVKLKKTIDESGMPPETLKIANQEFRKLKSMTPAMSEYMVTLNYVETLANLPWTKRSDDKIDIAETQKVLDEDHYGLLKTKERVLEYLAVRKLTEEKKGAILCFVGPPGTGKTSICESIAKAMGRQFIRMSLGGVHDEAEIRGHRRTYVGAMVGKVIQQMKRAGVNNPLFVFDEIDKLSKDFRGDPASALLEVLDPAQNYAFVDNYLNVPFDLSNVFFITTANDLGPIPAPLRDRMEIIEIPGYSPFEKLKIAQNHLIPKQKKANGLKDLDVSISPQAIMKVIEEYTSEAGVRSLERECGSVLRKVAVNVAAGKKAPSVVKVDAIQKLLGPPKIFAEKAGENPEVGLSTGLAWSQHGGSLLFVEASLCPGKGSVQLTGNLGKIIQESATAAMTWIKANYSKFGIDLNMFSQNDVHIHFPAGATPKDGPSAGIAITSAILSLFTGKPVRNDIAMTGEISLRGRVMPIGGLMEKVLAAHRGGIKEVLFPTQNQHDLEEIPQEVRNEIILTPISNLMEAIEKLLISAPAEGSAGEINLNKNDDPLVNMGR